mmetsp:Transcript_51607/g.77199  ORF Transcript_51607/g.77199 Transcript_51607/m.77199 type:complete len:294 (-) Transcript_51607:139-1020(-)
MYAHWLSCKWRFGKMEDYSQRSVARDRLVRDGLSRPISYPMEECDFSSLSQREFQDMYVAYSKALVIRNFASSWPAIKKWCDLDFWVKEHGHRTVPIELGSMMKKGGMKEQLMTMRKFISSYLASSSDNGCWTLDSIQKDTTKDKIAYLAQHQLFEQMTDLLNDIDASPSFCGESGPVHINTWIGTGGTRTPLHFDSYDNLFVQLVGCKYVRIYNSDQSEKLYVMRKKDSPYGLQGNMSALDCENEDFEKYPLARTSEFVEVLMFPGDCLFIPSRAWHYVRGLSTSISVNFWW